MKLSVLTFRLCMAALDVHRTDIYDVKSIFSIIYYPAANIIATGSKIDCHI